jgi:hypothetical protein
MVSGEMLRRLTAVVGLALAVMALAASPATAARDGVYRGKTPGALEVKIKVKNNRVVLFDGDVYTSIGITSFVFPPSGQAGKFVRIKANGSFRAVFQASPGEFSWSEDKRVLTGRFIGNRVSGKMTVSGLISGSDTFTARC